jgi:hypothetical protein
MLWLPYSRGCSRTRHDRHRLLQLLLLRCRNVRINSNSSNRSLAAAGNSAATFWLHVACSHCYRSCSLPAHVATCFSSDYYPSDSSSIAQWASKSGTASCTVCFTPLVGFAVACFTRDRVDSGFLSNSHGLHSYSVRVSTSGRHSSLPEGATFSELIG